MSGVSSAESLGDTNAGDSAKPTKTWVDARITVSGSSTNAVGAPHTFTVTVEKNLGTGGGFVAAAGETVTSSLTGAGTISAGTCTTTSTDLSGQCTIIVGSSSAGTSTLSASVSLSVSGVSLTRSLGDANAGDSAKPTKTSFPTRRSADLSSTNAVGAPHTFTVTVEKNLGTGGGFVAAA